MGSSGTSRSLCLVQDHHSLMVPLSTTEPAFAITAMFDVEVSRYLKNISGWSSFMVPSLATYFGQTSSRKSLNYHYKRNILATNVFFGLIFACLVIHLNVGSAESSYLKRNHLLCCHQYGGHLSNASLSLSSKPCKG